MVEMGVKAISNQQLTALNRAHSEEVISKSSVKSLLPLWISGIAGAVGGAIFLTTVALSWNPVGWILLAALTAVAVVAIFLYLWNRQPSPKMGQEVKPLVANQPFVPWIPQNHLITVPPAPLQGKGEELLEKLGQNETTIEGAMPNPEKPAEKVRILNRPLERSVLEGQDPAPLFQAGERLYKANEDHPQIQMRINYRLNSIIQARQEYLYRQMKAEGRDDKFIEDELQKTRNGLRDQITAFIA